LLDEVRFCADTLRTLRATQRGLGSVTSSESKASIRRPPISVLVPCFNNEAYIEECLAAVAWADEVVLVDSFSTDRTLKVAGPYVNRILQHEYDNSARQKNWAIPQATHEWVFVVDTDEIVTTALRREIEAAVANPSGFTGFRIPRKNIVFGRWLRGGGYWPDYQIRLFRKDSGCYEDRQVHAHVLLDGPCGTLTSPYVHHPHRSLRSIRRTLLQRYSSWEAVQKYEEGTRFRWHQLVVRPAGAFVTRDFLKGGFRDGWQGWLMSFFWAAYVFNTYWKLGQIVRSRTYESRVSKAPAHPSQVPAKEDTLREASRSPETRNPKPEIQS
jgi:glycosyltransferase involved in cell wall biosynthesis